MKKLIFILFIPIIFKGQDTIIKKGGEVIMCKITKVTSSNIFYTENKIGKAIAISETGYYSNPIVKQDEIKNSQTCKVKKEADKFEGDIKYKADFPKWFEIIKYKKGESTNYYLSLWTEGTSGLYGKEGVIILFTDGTKIEKPNIKVDCDFRANVMYDYRAFFRLNDNELELLKTKLTKGIRLYIMDREWGDKKAENIKQQTICLFNEI